MSKFVSFLRDESGASAAEYVLILTIIGSALALAVVTFGNAMANALGDAGDTIEGYSF